MLVQALVTLMPRLPVPVVLHPSLDAPVLRSAARVDAMVALRAE